VLCTLIFDHLGLFMTFSRTGLLLFVPLIWFINIVISALWLSKVQQGPMEWLWRKLTKLTGGKLKVQLM